MKQKIKVRIFTPEEGESLVVTKTGRNELCPCGSGKKVKHCCKETHKYLIKQNKNN